MFDYFYNCLRKAGLYFSLPTSHQNVDEYNKSMKSGAGNKKSQQKKDINHIPKHGKGLVNSDNNMIETNKNSSSVKLESETTEQVSVCPVDTQSIVMKDSTDNQLSVSDIHPSYEQSTIGVDDDDQVARKDGAENGHGEKQFAIEIVEKVINDAVDTVKMMSIDDKNCLSESSCDQTTVLDSSKNHNDEKMDVREDSEDYQQDKADEVVSNSDSCFGSDSESDQKSESSPVVNMRREMTSPIGAEYNYKFDSQTLTDGKVRFILYDHLFLYFLFLNVFCCYLFCSTYLCELTFFVIFNLSISEKKSSYYDCCSIVIVIQKL